MKQLIEGLGISKILIEDIIYMCESRTKSTYFTRSANCKMDFQSLIMFGLNFVKKTLQIELDLFFETIKGGENGISKQGYSEARQKISPTAFIKLADAIMSWYYGDDDYKTFNGYRLSAIDGSLLELNNSERLRNAFGYAEGKDVKLARAKASCIYDLENDMVITSKITSYFIGEREIAIEQYKDGITTDAQGLPTLTRIIAKMLPPMSSEQNNKFWLNTLKDKHVRTAAAFGFIAVPDLTNNLQVVKAGQLWGRLHLLATSKGLGMQIMNQLSERRDRELALNLTPQFGDKLREILKTSEWHSIIQFRMGYPTIEALPSPRRPVKDVIVSTI